MIQTETFNEKQQTNYKKKATIENYTETLCFSASHRKRLRAKEEEESAIFLYSASFMICCSHTDPFSAMHLLTFKRLRFDPLHDLLLVHPLQILPVCRRRRPLWFERIRFTLCVWLRIHPPRPFPLQRGLLLLLYKRLLRLRVGLRG